MSALSSFAIRAVAAAAASSSTSRAKSARAAVRTTLRPDVRTAREARRGTKGRPVAPSALDAVVAAAPSDRDALLKRWYLKRAAAAWRRWCEAWYAAFHFGAPVAVALALARAAEIHAALEHVTTK